MSKEIETATSVSNEMVTRLVEQYPELKPFPNALENIAAKIYVAFMKGKKTQRGEDNKDQT